MRTVDRVISGVNHEWIRCEFEAEGTSWIQTWRPKIAQLYLGTGKNLMQPGSGGTGGD